MIEFDGYLTGVTEKHFYKKVATYEQNITLICITLILPMVIQVGKIIGNVEVFFCIFCSLYLIIPLVARIPKSTREKKELTPHRVYLEGDCVVSFSEKFTEKRLISDVIFVRDYGDFYELVFPLRKLSNRFICQKELLKLGTLQEFERLFEGKILVQ